MGRPANGASKQIDRIIPGIGRFQVRTGSQSSKTNKAIDVMIDRMVETGETKPLTLVLQKEMTLLELWQRYEKKDGSHKLSKEALKPAVSAMRDWLLQYDKISDTTRANHRSIINQLEKVARASDTVEELPAILERYKKVCQKNKTARVFNQARNVVRSFLRSTVGKRSDLYLDVQDLDTLNETAKRTPVKMLPEMFKKFTDKLPKPIADSCWSMALTGMELNVYFADDKFEVKTDRVVIHGEKQRHKDNRRDRVIPLFGDVVLPPLKIKAFRKQVNTVQANFPDNPKMVLSDLRKIFAVWMREAGIDPTRQQQYMGHAPKTMTDHYSAADVSDFLTSDAKIFRAWMRKAITGKATSSNQKFDEFFEMA